MSLESLEYTAVPNHPCSQHSQGDSYRICSNLLLFSLGTHAWIHSFCKDFSPLSAPWTVSLLSFYISPLLLSLSHQIKSLRFTFKAICSLSLPSPLSQGWYPKPAPISDQPQTPAPISQLLIWWAKNFQLFPHRWGKASPAYHRATAWFSSKFLF